ncbi:DCP2-domain-containing protein [Clavulina sp. PMI_390]|nr:DCP2-domain-containing protein [Clavulina sp. PMI_390]
MLHQSSVDGPVASTSSAHPPQPKPPAIKYATLDEVLEDLSSRFILNLPDEELVSVERICFQVEQAHWYYEDFIRDANPSFPGMALKTFSRHLFEACPLLQHWSKDHDQAFQDFLAYKTSVPVCGVIMLNSSYTKCVLVKGWKSSSSWTFPRGKINADEPEHECAAREALEETGYDVTDKIHKDLVIRTTLKEQETSLFIVPNVPEDTVFIPQTRKEISKVDWFLLADLPGWKKGPVKDTAHKFYAINPIIRLVTTL